MYCCAEPPSTATPPVCSSTTYVLTAVSHSGIVRCPTINTSGQTKEPRHAGTADGECATENVEVDPVLERLLTRARDQWGGANAARPCCSPKRRGRGDKSATAAVGGVYLEGGVVVFVVW